MDNNFLKISESSSDSWIWTGFRIQHFLLYVWSFDKKIDEIKKDLPPFCGLNSITILIWLWSRERKGHCLVMNWYQNLATEPFFQVLVQCICHYSTVLWTRLIQLTEDTFFLGPSILLFSTKNCSGCDLDLIYVFWALNNVLLTRTW